MTIQDYQKKVTELTEKITSIMQAFRASSMEERLALSTELGEVCGEYELACRAACRFDPGFLYIDLVDVLTA